MNIKGINPGRGQRAGFLLVLLLAATGAGSAELPAVPDLGGEALDLAQAMDLALQHNPRLHGFRAATAEAMAHAEQVSRGLNPELDFELENFAGSGEAQGFSAAEYTLMLSQTFELGGKRTRERAVADREVDLVKLDAALQTREIRTRVSQAFLATLVRQNEVTLAEELVVLAQQDLEYVKRRIEQGAVSPVEENRARLAVSTAKLTAQAARGALKARKLQLSVLWNSETPSFGLVLGDLERLDAKPEWSELSALLAGSPQLLRWDAEARRRQAEVNAAMARGKLDLTAGAGLRHYADSGDNALVAAVSLPLQFRDKNNDGVRAAQFGLDRLGAERQAQYVAMLGQLARHYEQLAISYDQVVAMRNEILPLAQQSMAEVEAAHRKGLFSLTDVMATRRTWFEAQGDYFGALARYQEAAFEVTLLLGDDSLNTLLTQEKD
jgi:cobalt-zinc-cadmium efflux system outer membrane protein